MGLVHNDAVEFKMRQATALKLDERVYDLLSMFKGNKDRFPLVPGDFGGRVRYSLEKKSGGHTELRAMKLHQPLYIVIQGNPLASTVFIPLSDPVVAYQETSSTACDCAFQGCRAIDDGPIFCIATQPLYLTPPLL